MTANLGFISSNYNYEAINLKAFLQSWFAGDPLQFLLQLDASLFSRYFANLALTYSINRISL